MIQLLSAWINTFCKPSPDLHHSAWQPMRSPLILRRPEIQKLIPSKSVPREQNFLAFLRRWELIFFFQSIAKRELRQDRPSPAIKRQIMPIFRGYTNPLEMSSQRPSYFRYYIRAGTITAYVVPLLTMLNCSTRGA